MTTFHLQVVTPDGCAFDGQAERVVCRTIRGDVCVLARHSNYVTALGMGDAHVIDEAGKTRHAACMGGMLSVMNGEVRLVATTWEWADQIDEARAEASKARAEKILERTDLDDREHQLAEARLKRALVRTSVAKLHD
ncbi:MAG: ATP synthase F1 subunit epsilon [Oscillospiraceae bacterium]|nr:ATP synthase F1 subunit epsilon [Oscillospiraceae bacterium]